MSRGGNGASINVVPNARLDTGDDVAYCTVVDKSVSEDELGDTAMVDAFELYGPPVHTNLTLQRGSKLLWRHRRARFYMREAFGRVI